MLWKHHSLPITYTHYSYLIIIIPNFMAIHSLTDGVDPGKKSLHLVYFIR